MAICSMNAVVWLDGHTGRPAGGDCRRIDDETDRAEIESPSIGADTYAQRAYESALTSITTLVSN